jgi:hypothetical protein
MYCFMLEPIHLTGCAIRYSVCNHQQFSILRPRSLSTSSSLSLNQKPPRMSSTNLNPSPDPTNPEALEKRQLEQAYTPNSAQGTSSTNEIRGTGQTQTRQDNRGRVAPETSQTSQCNSIISNALSAPATKRSKPSYSKYPYLI